MRINEFHCNAVLKASPWHQQGALLMRMANVQLKQDGWTLFDGKVFFRKSGANGRVVAATSIFRTKWLSPLELLQRSRGDQLLVAYRRDGFALLDLGTFGTCMFLERH